MSICREIENYRHPDLHCLESLICGGDTARTLYVADVIWHIVHPPYPHDVNGTMHAELRQLLDAFLENAKFTVADDPDCKPSDAQIARVWPVEDEIFDFRVTVPNPGLRVLGAFWEKDVFVALTWDYRDNFKVGWEEEVDQCNSEWRRLFGVRAPLQGNTLDEYLSNFIPV